MVTRNVACLTAVALAFATGIATATVGGRIDDVVRIENIQTSGDTVRGRIVNQTDDALENVRVVVADQFLWRNERHPGANSPSAAHTYTVPGPVPPHGSITFEFRRAAPLPNRPDGQFTTDVSAVEVTRRPIVAGAGYEPRTRYDHRAYYGDRPPYDDRPRYDDHPYDDHDDDDCPNDR
jgi:hypothetical protein